MVNDGEMKMIDKFYSVEVVTFDVCKNLHCF